MTSDRVAYLCYKWHGIFNVGYIQGNLGLIYSLEAMCFHRAKNMDKLGSLQTIVNRR